MDIHRICASWIKALMQAIRQRAEIKYFCSNSTKTIKLCCFLHYADASLWPTSCTIKLKWLHRQINLNNCVCVSHLADLIEGVLSISSSVFEVVMSWECPVNVPGDGTVLWGLLTVRQRRGNRQKGQREWKEVKAYDRERDFLSLNPQDVFHWDTTQKKKIPHRSSSGQCFSIMWCPSTRLRFTVRGRRSN